MRAVNRITKVPSASVQGVGRRDKEVGIFSRKLKLAIHSDAHQVFDEMPSQESCDYHPFRQHCLNSKSIRRRMWDAPGMSGTRCRRENKVCNIGNTIRDNREGGRNERNASRTCPLHLTSFYCCNA